MALSPVFEPSPELHPVQIEQAAPEPEITELVDTPLPEYDIGLAHPPKTVRRADLDTPYGNYYERTVTMDDGAIHSEIIGISLQPDADKVVVSVPAWWTSIQSGVNKGVSDQLHAHGFHTLIKGVPHNTFTSLSRGAHDLHVSLGYDDGFGYFFDSDEILLQGDSNGAMQGTGAIAYAPAFGRKVIDAFLVDPCLVRPIGRKDIKKLIRHPLYVAEEMVCLGRHALTMALDPETDMREVIRTVEFDENFILGNLRLAYPLFKGEFGHLLAHVNPDQAVHYLHFDHSIANQKSDFTRIVNGRPGGQGKTTQRVVPGTHMSIADPRTTRTKLEYLIASSQKEVAA